MKKRHILRPYCHFKNTTLYYTDRISLDTFASTVNTVITVLLKPCTSVTVVMRSGPAGTATTSCPQYVRYWCHCLQDQTSYYIYSSISLIDFIITLSCRHFIHFISKLSISTIIFNNKKKFRVAFRLDARDSLTVHSILTKTNSLDNRYYKGKHDIYVDVRKRNSSHPPKLFVPDAVCEMQSVFVSSYLLQRLCAVKVGTETAQLEQSWTIPHTLFSS